MSSWLKCFDLKVLSKVAATLVFWIRDTQAPLLASYLYAIGNDKTGFLRSDDNGMNWKSVSTFEFSIVQHINQCLLKKIWWSNSVIFRCLTIPITPLVSTRPSTHQYRCICQVQQQFPAQVLGHVNWILLKLNFLRYCKLFINF